MSLKDWIDSRRRRIDESQRAAESTRVEHERIKDQWPEVEGLVGFSREQRRINHLSQLILDMHRGDN